MMARYEADVDLVTTEEAIELMAWAYELVVENPDLTGINVSSGMAPGVPYGWFSVHRGLGRPACRCT